MRICKHFIIPILLPVFAGLSPAFAQIHLEPHNGEDGLPGSITGSFIIKWASVDSAVDYEYIMSDNPLCFSGCPGDTRQQKTGGNTTATEYNLQEGKWYYWITRIYYQNGDSSGWSLISSFLAKTPAAADTDQLIKIFHNPGISGITFEIDWAVSPKAEQMSMELYSLSGQAVSTVIVINKEGTGRYQTVNDAAPELQQGTYIALFVVDDNPNNPNNRFTEKIIIAQ